MNVIKLLDRPIAFHRAFLELTGSIEAALLLSQAFYWSKRTSDEDGWFWKTAEEWKDETGLSRTQIETARKALKTQKFWCEKLQGLPAKMFYRIDLDILEKVLLGEDQESTVESILETYGTRLGYIANAAYMRAKAAGKEAERVDYAAILRTHGLTCSGCGKPIIKGIGVKEGCLTFDHLIPLAKGGSHTAQNIRPTHAECNRRKGDCWFQPQKSSLLEAKQTGSLATKQTGSLGGKQAIISETTAETTAEIAKKTFGASAPPLESVSVASPACTGSLPGLEAEPPTESGIAAPPLAVGGPQGETPASTPPPPSKRPKAEKETNPDFNEFRDAFMSAFKRRTGSPYAFQGGKDGTAVKRVLAVCGGAEGAIRLLDAMEAAPESWTHKSCRAGLCSIAVMSSRLNEIRAELAASSRVPGTKPTAPATPVPKAKPQFEFNGKVYEQEPPRSAFPAGQIGDQIHEAAVAKWKRWVQFGEA